MGQFNMRVFVLSLAFLALASATSYKSQFEAFEHEFGKNYKSSAERLTRFATFMKNVKEIEEHNKSGKSSYIKVINKFADMTAEEFKVMNGYKNAPKPGTVFAKTDKNVKVEDYPYTSGNMGITGNCKYSPNSMDTLATVRGYETLPRNNLEAVMNHIANVGPLSVAVAASAWSFYGGGVFDGCDYDKNIEINHAVQLVGYGTDASEGDYWIIRNSWGPGWGENGFMRLKRESTAVC